MLWRSCCATSRWAFVCNAAVLLGCGAGNVSGTQTVEVLRAMSSEDLVQYALQLQNASDTCNPCSPGNPCKNEGRCFVQHETGLLPDGQQCVSDSLAVRTAEINEQCCGADDATCHDGTPTSCDSGCASVFLPFWKDCAEALQASDLSRVVALCSNGVAEVQQRGFTCECADGWRGDMCDVATGCDSSPCGVHGFCTATGGRYTCACQSGWSGPRCDVNQCSLPYLTISDPWRGTDYASGSHGDRQLGDPTCPSSYANLNRVATGVGGGNWYRFTGSAGNALPLQPISTYSPLDGMLAKDGKGYHCGTGGGGWLSGWAGVGGPKRTYKNAGRYPSVADGVVNRTVCFDETTPGYPNPCFNHVTVEVVRCDAGFLLWHLPYAPSCTHGYCTTHDMSAERSTGCDVAGHFVGSGNPCGEHATCIADGSRHTCKAQCMSECKGSCGCLNGMCDFTSHNCVGGCYAYDSSC